jgi:hypothetical protein
MRILIQTIREFPDDWFDDWIIMSKKTMNMDDIDKQKLLLGLKCYRKDIEPGGHSSVETTVEILNER